MQIIAFSFYKGVLWQISETPIFSNVQYETPTNFSKIPSIVLTSSVLSWCLDFKIKVFIKFEKASWKI